MKLITRSLLAVAFVCLFASCSQDEELLIEEQVVKEEVQITADLVVEDQFASDILNAVNEYRAELGKPAFAFNNDSKSKAVEHSKYMASKNEISHDNFYERSDYLKARGAERVSENVAYGYRSADEVLQAWLRSESHKDAIEGDFSHSGIAVVKNKNGVSYFTQIFITK